jgi:hypothetical protein
MELMSATPQLAVKLTESTGVGNNWWFALKLHLKVGLGARVRMHLYLFWLCVFSRRERQKDVVFHCEITWKTPNRTETLHELIGLGLSASVCQWRLTCSVMMWLTFGYLARKIAHVCQGVHGHGKAGQGGERIPKRDN